MSKFRGLPPAESRRVKTPMIMRLRPTEIIYVVNQQLEKEGRPLIPVDAELSVRVPGGGDYSDTDLELDEGSIFLDIRWET